MLSYITQKMEYKVTKKETEYIFIKKIKKMKLFRYI